MIQVSAIMTMGGLGTIAKPTTAHKNAIVAMLTIFISGFVVGWAPITYVVTTEVPSLRLRDASQRTASIVNVATNFLVSFSIPYLLYEPYAALGSRVGFIFGSIAVLAIMSTFFCVPECKGKTLEQVDRLFIEGVPLRKFGSYVFEEDSSDEVTLEKGKAGASVETQERV